MADKKQTYHAEKDTQNVLQLRELLSTMPPFAKQYFRAIEPTTQTRTRLSYAYDIRTFFRYLQETNPHLKTQDILTWKVSLLDQLTAVDIEEYQEFLKVYNVDESGYMYNRGILVTCKDAAIIPALVLDLDSTVYEYAGTFTIK